MRRMLIALMVLGWTVYTPGQLPTQIQERPGGYTVYEPGKLPTQIDRNPGGSMTIYEPGKLPVQVAPSPPVVHPITPQPLWR